MKGARSSGRNTVELVHIEDGGSPECIGGLPVYVGTELDVIVEPKGL